MKRFTALLLLFSILTLSIPLSAKKRKGADIIVQRLDGQQVRGELISVQQDSLLLLDRDSGADVSVELNKIKIIKIIQKSRTGTGFLVGGAIGALIGFVSYEPSWFDFGEGGSAVMGGILGGFRSELG